MTQSEEMAFLKSLMAEEEDEVRLPLSECPEPAILWSLTQNDREGSEMVKELRAHVAGCKSCADLSGRLHAFYHEAYVESAPVPDKDWAQTEPRLNKWMTRYLKAQPTSAAGKSRWHLSNMSWGMGFAAASCAIVVIGAVIWAVHGTGPQPGHDAEVALLPAHPDVERPASPKSSDDSTVLMNDGHALEPVESAGDEPSSISLVNGDRLKLLVTAIQSHGDGSYKLEGKLFPEPSSQMIHYIADVGAVFSGSSKSGLELIVREATFNRRIYRRTYRRENGAETGQLFAVFPQIGSEVPSVGETLDITISAGKTSLIAVR